MSLLARRYLGLPPIARWLLCASAFAASASLLCRATAGSGAMPPWQAFKVGFLAAAPFIAMCASFFGMELRVPAGWKDRAAQWAQAITTTFILVVLGIDASLSLAAGIGTGSVAIAASFYLAKAAIGAWGAQRKRNERYCRVMQG